MASTKISVTNAAWVQIMPASADAFCIVDGPYRIFWKRSAAQPTVGDTDYSDAGGHDQINGSAVDPTWAIAANSDCTVVRHDN